MTPTAASHPDPVPEVDALVRPSAGAVFDRTGAYRYRLWRRWGQGPKVLFVLLNPSTADARRDDPTVRRCIGFARRWGFGALEIVNLFALRATDPRCLREAAEPVGPANDRHIRGATRDAGLVVAGWGNRAGEGGRAAAVCRALARRHALHCLGTTAAGQPRHPLYVPAATRPTVWARGALHHAEPPPPDPGAPHPPDGAMGQGPV